MSTQIIDHPNTFHLIHTLTSYWQYPPYWQPSFQDLAHNPIAHPQSQSWDKDKGKHKGN